MKKRQSKSSLIKGIVATCLLFNHLSGYVPIVKAFSSNNLDEGVQSEVETNDFYSVLEDNQFVTTPNETSPIVEEGDIELETDESLLEVESGDLTNEENLSNEEKDQLDQLPLETQQELSILTDEELIIEDSNVMAQEEIEVSTGSESRSVGAGLVQLWQVVPSGQTQEGKTTSEIMKALQCRPNHNLYPLNGSTQHQTYVNSCYVDDALYLGEDDTYYHIYLSGYEGKVPKSETHTFSLDLNGDGKYVDYQIQTVAYYIPGSTVKAISNDEVIHPDAPELNYYDQYLNKYSEAEARSIDFYSTATIQSPSYYANDNGTLVHYVTNNVKVANNYSKITVGKAPSWMSSGVKYYSYDGIYFYTNWQNIRVNGQGAVNQNNPFYNYYQYLPFRSKTNYSANAIDSYTNNNGGTGGKLVNTGQYFYAVQDNYGINGALQYAMGIHESGWGKSSLSIDKNNLFGMNATDNNPYGNGTSFPTVESGINYHADRYLSWGYTDPIDDYRYYGSHVGNKGSGMNVKYASDPFWGEKIAGWYYKFDQANGMKDYNYYSIGIKQSQVIANVRSGATTSSSILYQTKNKKTNQTIRNYPVLITGTKDDYYSIKSDTPIVNGVAKFNGKYDWGLTDVYISKNTITVVNHHDYKRIDGLIGWQWIDNRWYYYNENSNPLTGWQVIDGIKYYFDNMGQMITGWKWIDNSWYYFNESGHMQQWWKWIDGIHYYFNGMGQMLTGWQVIDGNRYYFNESGHSIMGWKYIDNAWYYFNNDNGQMMTGWQVIDGIKYYFDNMGQMITGWKWIDNSWYYFNESGHMQQWWKWIDGIHYYFNGMGQMLTGWQVIDGNRYYFNESGHSITGLYELNGKIYYFDEWAIMWRGWKYIENDWYYFEDSGVALTGWQVIDGIKYYFNEFGKMATGNQTIDGVMYYFNNAGHLVG